MSEDKIVKPATQIEVSWIDNAKMDWAPWYGKSPALFMFIFWIVVIITVSIFPYAAIGYGIAWLFFRNKKYPALVGECPYCDTTVQVAKNLQGTNCPACAKRFVIVGDSFQSIRS